MRNALQLAGIVLFTGLGAYVGCQLQHAGTVAFVLWLGGPTLAVALFALVRAWQDGVLREWFSLRRGDVTIAVLTAALLFGAAFGMTRLVAPVGSARESWLARLYLQLGDPATLLRHAWFVGGAVVVIAIAEELVWRGLVPLLLAEWVGSRRAWVWAAVLYAVAVLPTALALRDPVAGANPVLPLGALGAGLVLGALLRKFDRLVPSILAHALFDWTVVMTFRLWRL